MPDVRIGPGGFTMASADCVRECGAVAVRRTFYTGARHVHTDDELAAVAASLPSDGTAHVLLTRIGDARRFAAMVRAV